MATLITSSIFNDPSLNPFFNPAYFDLNPNASTPDDVTLAPNVLASFPGGLRALDGNDSIEGSAVAEIINGNAGNDRIFSQEGNDTLLGGKDSDVVSGGKGDDFVAGNLGRDWVYGGEGNDYLRGGRDSDLLVGGDGNDILIGDFGLDYYKGGEGNDIFGLRFDTLINAIQGDAIVVDFNKSSDFIGLSGGLTERALSFEQVNVSVNDLLNSPNFNDAVSFAMLTREEVDPNGDNIVQFTNIFANEALLANVLNVTPADLSGRFTAFNA